MVKPYRFALMLAFWAAPAHAECFRIGDTITCINNVTGGVDTTDSVRVNIRSGASVINIPLVEVLGYCPLSPPTIVAGDRSIVTNDGTVVALGTCASGVIVGDDSAVFNNGSIDTINAVAHAIEIGNRGTIVNTGAITTRGDVAYGIAGFNNVAVTNASGATIITAGTGAAGVFLGANATVTNHGTIRTSAIAAATIEIVEDIFRITPANSIITNTGLLDAQGARTDAVQAVADRLTLINSGQIKGLFRDTQRLSDYSRAISLTAESVTVVNSGSIAGAALGLRANVLRDLTIINSGIISGQFDVGQALETSSDTVTLTNSGVITGRLMGARLTARGNVDLSNSGVIEIMGGTETEIEQSALDIITAFNTNSSISNSGQILARVGGTAIKTGAGNETVINSGTIRGGVDLGAGDDVLILRSGATLAGQLIAGSGTDRLVLLDNGTLNWAASGFEDLLMLSDGRWTVAQDFSALNVAGILSGEMRIEANRTLSAPGIVVNTGGTLSGQGTARGRVINSGSLLPGPGLATLTIDGDLIQESTGLYAADIGVNGASDKLVISGIADLDGTLAVTKPTTLRLRGSERYDILTAGQGIIGTFAQITGANSTFMTAALERSADNRTLSLRFSRLPYASATDPGNARNVAVALDSAYAAGRSGLSGLFDQFDAADAPTARQAMEQLSSPLPITVAVTTTLAARAGLMALAPRFAVTTSEHDQMRAWGHVSRSNGASDRGDAAQAYASDSHSLIAGLDRTSSDGVRIGLAMGQQKASIDYRIGRATADLDATLVAAYASGTWSGVQISGAVMWGDGDVAALRTATAPVLRTLTSAADTGMIGADLMAAWPIIAGNFLLSPSLRLQGVRGTVTAFSETGPYGLTLAPQSHSSLRPELGMRASITPGRFHPYLRLAVSHETLNRPSSIQAAFTADTATAFSIRGVVPHRTWLMTEAGFDIPLNNGVAVSLGMSGNPRNPNNNHNFFAGLSARW